MKLDSNLIDIVTTPYAGFAMIDVQGVPADPLISAMSPPGKRAVAFDLSPGDYISQVGQIAVENPDYMAGPVISHLGLTLEKAKLSELVSEATMMDAASRYAAAQQRLRWVVGNPEDLMLTPAQAYDYVMYELFFELCERLAIQHGENFLRYPKIGVSALKFDGRELWLASQDGGSGGRYGGYEILVYGCSLMETRFGPLYPVATYEASLEQEKTGLTSDEFVKEFFR